MSSHSTVKAQSPRQPRSEGCAYTRGVGAVWFSLDEVTITNPKQVGLVDME